MSLRLSALPATVMLSLVTSTLAACSTSPATPPTASCNAGATQAYVGQAATPEVVDAARKEAGAVLVRTLKPGQMVTMEFRDGRLNVHVDAGNVILRTICG